MASVDSKSMLIGALLGVCMCLALAYLSGLGAVQANAQTAANGAGWQYQAFGVGPNPVSLYLLNTQTGELWHWGSVVDEKGRALRRGWTKDGGGGFLSEK